MYGDKIYLVDIFDLNKRRIVQFRDKITSFGFAILQGIHYSVQKTSPNFPRFLPLSDSYSPALWLPAFLVAHHLKLPRGGRLCSHRSLRLGSWTHVRDGSEGQVLTSVKLRRWLSRMYLPEVLSFLLPFPVGVTVSVAPGRNNQFMTEKVVGGGKAFLPAVQFSCL